MNTIDVARLREVLGYDPDTGIFTWKTCLSRNVKIGGVAGTVTGHGYLVIKVDKVTISAHRLAIAYVEGEFPPNHVDHRNGVRSDNRYANLRHATKAENQQNRALSVHNTSGCLGASLNKRTGRWVAQIECHRVKKHLGYFDTPEEAHAAYLSAKKQLHTFNPVPRQ